MYPSEILRAQLEKNKGRKAKYWKITFGEQGDVAQAETRISRFGELEQYLLANPDKIRLRMWASCAEHNPIKLGSGIAFFADSLHLDYHQASKISEIAALVRAHHADVTLEEIVAKIGRMKIKFGCLKEHYLHFAFLMLHMPKEGKTQSTANYESRLRTLIEEFED